MMNLETGNDYIVKEQGDVQKIRVIELTKTSIKISYLDSAYTKRFTLEDFQRRFSMLEDLGNQDLAKFRSQTKII